MVDVPTRENNILDIVLCNDPLLICDVCVGPPFSTSDHETVSCIINFNVVVTSTDAQNNIDHPHNLNGFDENGIIICSAFDWEAADWPNLNFFL